MSLRNKKEGHKKDSEVTVFDHGQNLVATKCTPAKSNEEHQERNKTKSSMKKLKKLLKRRSKTKSFCMDSPSADHLRKVVNNNGSASYKQVDIVNCPEAKSSELDCKLLSSKRSRMNDDKCEVVKPIKRARTTDENINNIKVVTNSAMRSKKTIQSCRLDADELFKYVISPVPATKFFKEMWQQKPLLIRRHDPHYNKDWFSTEELDNILREESVKFTENIDVVTYLGGKRETHNPEGRAYAPIVWDYYQNGCSVRLLNPHTYSHNVWSNLSRLQEYFGCVAGANVYLTPPGSQGFAPHWDDIEAFVMQLEGKKRWRVYEPREESEVLPLESSPNFSDSDLTGPPVLDTILESGDLLYMPRGFIHQGETLEESHSLHITLSVGQKNTWGELLKTLLPRAVEIAVEEDVEFRRDLPHNYLNYMGVAFSDESSTERTKFIKTVERLVTKLLPHVPIDAGCDQMAKQFLQNSLPPVLSQDEQLCSVHGNGEHWDATNNCVRGAVEIEPDTEIRVIRRGSIRLITEDDKVFVYHNIENARMLHNDDVQCIEVEPQMAEAVEFLLKRYPEFIGVDSLPLDNIQERVALATDLYDRGLVMTREPLESLSDDGSCCESHSDCS